MIVPAPFSLRPTRVLALFLVAWPFLACGGDGDGEPSGPTPVASVAVTSPIEDVMAVDRTVQLTSTAQDASGNTLSGRSFTWSSTDGSVASVDETGLVQGLASGNTTITAAADGVTGSLEMDVVPAELEKISGLLDDAYTGQLSGSLTAGPGDAVQTALQNCSGALDVGHILDLAVCLQQIQAESASDPTDQALLAFLGVIALRAELLLHL